MKAWDYTPDFFSPSESDFFFAKITSETAWRSEKIKIFGKEILQPRMTFFMGDDGVFYRYSGITMHAQKWTGEILLIKNRIEKVAGTDFNCVLLNFYRDGNDSMSWHADNEPELGKSPVIASVSFGAERVFEIRHKIKKSEKTRILLENGSLLLMKKDMQENFQHQLPKKKKITEARLNLTFRKILTL